MCKPIYRYSLHLTPKPKDCKSNICIVQKEAVFLNPRYKQTDTGQKRTVFKDYNVTSTELIIPKILIFRRIYRTLHEPGGSPRNQRVTLK